METCLRWEVSDAPRRIREEHRYFAHVACRQLSNHLLVLGPQCVAVVTLLAPVNCCLEFLVARQTGESPLSVVVTLVADTLMLNQYVTTANLA